MPKITKPRTAAQQYEAHLRTLPKHALLAACRNMGITAPKGAGFDVLRALLIAANTTH